jgi:hypothetical protein
VTVILDAVMAKRNMVKSKKGKLVAAPVLQCSRVGSLSVTGDNSTTTR